MPQSAAGTDRRPLLTSRRAKGWRLASTSTASRKVRLTSLFGRDEVGAARRVADVLVGGRRALGVIAVEQALGRLARYDELELPRQVVDVLDAAVRAARAERRDQVRRVAGEERAAAAERAQAPALEGVDAGPLDVEARLLAQHRAQPRQDPLRLLLLLRVGVPAELEIDAPDVVGLPVQQRRLVRDGTADRTRTSAPPENPTSCGCRR